MSRWDGALDDDWIENWNKEMDAKIARFKEELTDYVAGELCLHCWCEGGHAEHCERPRLALVEEK
jgi:hypothetical protein